MPAHQRILGTAGHIDHGKTALVRALTGVDTDRLPEEQTRGITIDIGFAHLQLGDNRLGIVDVPGHERFIRNMLAGAAGIDLAMLIIAADDSVMPQTREHLEILQLLNIRHGIVVITKVDRAESQWVDLVEEDARELVAGTFLEDAPLVRTAAIKGEGIDELRRALTDVCERATVDEARRPFRMAIDRSFVLTGLGTIVTGSVASGEASVGETLDWQPVARSVQVRNLQSHGEPAERIARGQRAAINLSGAHHTEVHRGHELTTPDYLKPSRLMTVELRVSADSPWPLRHRARVRLHIGTQEIIARVLLLEGTIVDPGQTAFAQLLGVEAICAAGRQPFVLRAESPVVTLGGGRVLQPAARRIRRNDADTIALLPGLADDDPLRRAETALRFSMTGRWSELDLCRDADLSLDEVGPIVDALRERDVIIDVGGHHLHDATRASLVERIRTVLRTLHERSPLDAAVPRSLVARRLRSLDERLLDALLANMRDSKMIVSTDDRSIALAEFKPKLSHEQRRIYDGIGKQLKASRFTPPGAAELAESLNAKPRDVQTVLDLGVGQGTFVHVGDGIVLHCDCADEMRDRVVALLTEHGEVTMAEIRTDLETSRKFAVPICEYLDRIGVTRRLGDKRVLVQRDSSPQNA